MSKRAAWSWKDVDWGADPPRDPQPETQAEQVRISAELSLAPPRAEPEPPVPATAVDTLVDWGLIELPGPPPPRRPAPSDWRRHKSYRAALSADYAAAAVLARIAAQAADLPVAFETNAGALREIEIHADGVRCGGLSRADKVRKLTLIAAIAVHVLTRLEEETDDHDET